jgi:hypothetical protein
VSTFARLVLAFLLGTCTLLTAGHALHATDPAQWVWPLGFGMATLVALVGACSSAWTSAAAASFERRQKASRSAIFDSKETAR